MAEAVRAPQSIQGHQPNIHGPGDQNSLIALSQLLNQTTQGLNVEELQAQNREELRASTEALEKALDGTPLQANSQVFDQLLQQCNRQINNETLQEDLAQASAQELQELRQKLKALKKALEQQPENLPPQYRNIYSHMVEFYSLVNETLLKLKATNNQQKREDKEDVKKNQSDKTRYTWFQCTIEMLSGAIAGCMAATSDFGRVAAEFGVSKVAAGANAVIHDKSQRTEHTVQTLDKKQDSARDRNQGMGRLDQEILRNISEAMRAHQRTLTDRNINS